MDLRAQQHNFIKTALGTNKPNRSKRLLPPSIFLWGQTNTGKSYVLDECLKSSGIPYQIYVDAVEVNCGWKVLLQSIYRQLLQKTSWFEQTQKVDGLDSFVSQFRVIGREVLKQQPLVIVVDHIDILRTENEDVLRLFMRLREYSGHNICVILLSHLPWRCYSHVTDCPLPLQLQFPQYTITEVVQIISSRAPPSTNTYAFEFYVDMVVNIHHAATRDLKALWKLVEKRQALFLENFAPTGHPTQEELNKKYKSILELLKSDVAQRHNRAIKLVEDKPAANACEMPKVLAYFLLAAFIASLNPATTDRKVFVKARTKMKHKRADAPNRSSKVAIPQPRIVAIFGKLSDARFWPDTGLQSCIEDLIQMGFLSRFGSDKLDEPKYRVHITPEFAEKLSESLEVKLDEVLSSRF